MSKEIEYIIQGENSLDSFNLACAFVGNVKHYFKGMIFNVNYEVLLGEPKTKVKLEFKKDIQKDTKKLIEENLLPENCLVEKITGETKTSRGGGE